MKARPPSFFLFQQTDRVKNEQVSDDDSEEESRVQNKRTTRLDLPRQTQASNIILQFTDIAAAPTHLDLEEIYDSISLHRIPIQWFITLNLVGANEATKSMVVGFIFGQGDKAFFRKGSVSGSVSRQTVNGISIGKGGEGPTNVN